MISTATKQREVHTVYILIEKLFIETLWRFC